MEIYLVRHGEYVDLGSRTLEEDSRNKLSATGIAKLQRQATTLATWNLAIERIITSPFVRAKETADIFAEHLQLAVDEHVGLTRTYFTLAALGQILSEYRDFNTLMLVGHESDLSTVTAAVVGGGKLEVARGGIIRIHLDSFAPIQGKLVWLLPPELMGA